MNIYSEILNDLIEHSQKIEYSIHHINWWLIKYEDDFYNAIPKSNCRKWTKWIRDNSIHVFPCVCPIREQDCIFIEMYFELLKASELEKKEVHFEKLVIEYNVIKNNETDVSLWLEKYESIWQNSHFNKIIRIKTSTTPYTKIEIPLSNQEFKNIRAFKKLYSRCYYSK
ncbi:hypothetical protein [Lacinutrix salivirga]